MSDIRVHAIEAGRLVGNETFLRADRWSSLIHPRVDCEFPVHCFLIEHPGGLIAVDTGLSPDVASPRPRLQRRFVPDPVDRSSIGSALRGAGFELADVRLVVLTHLDWDHAGGLAEFPGARVLVHRPEWEFAQTRFGRVRFEPQLWPAGFKPSLYELSGDPYGPFAASMPVTAEGDIRLVPLPGHTAGHVGVVVRTDRATFLLCGDHVLRTDWFHEDYAAGRLLGLGIWNPNEARDTSRRIHDFLADDAVRLLPSHDEHAAAVVAAAPGPIASAPRVRQRVGAAR